MAIIIWSKTAIADLNAIGRFISKDSVYYSKIVVRRLYDSVQRLALFPESGKVIPEFKQEHLREIIAKPFRIFYYHKNNEVRVLTIVHSKQDV